jgi:hypothetical protein
MRGIAFTIISWFHLRMIGPARPESDSLSVLCGLSSRSQRLNAFAFSHSKSKHFNRGARQENPQSSPRKSSALSTHGLALFETL